MQPTAVASPRKMQSGGTHTIITQGGNTMIGKYKIVRKATLEDYEARYKAMHITMEVAEERAKKAEVERDAADELLAEARDTCNAEIAIKRLLREQVLDQQETIKAHQKDIDRLLGETMQLTLEVEALRQENAALRKIAQADAGVTINDDDEEAGEYICEVTLCTESEEA